MKRIFNKIKKFILRLYLAYLINTYNDTVFTDYQAREKFLKKISEITRKWARL